MKKPFKYDASGLNEAQFEPGSGKRVLKNLLGIKSKRAMDKIEAAAYMMAIKESAKIYDKGHRFTLKDICKIHKIWLGKIYKWAGQYRNVNVSKGGFQFAAAKYVRHLMP
ncbi:MAG: Fic family protein, partial [Deltaproteobacteria bacterium]|nr:Fic family protein [Deltaproteobacteria bacterium]